MTSAFRGCRVLVTGGAGFIGQHLVERLDELGAYVTSLDVKRAPLPPTVQQVQADIRDPEALTRVLLNISPDYVMHLAANTDIRATRDSLEDVNVKGTEALLGALPESVKAALFVSSQLVVRMGIDPSDGTVFAPHSTYGETKAAMERIIRTNCKVPWCIVRPSTIWGPAHPTFPRTVWRYLKLGLYLHPDTGEPVIRSYGYVANAVSQMITILAHTQGVARHRVLYVSDPPTDSLLYLDAFSKALRGRPVRRVPALTLRAAAQVGQALHRIGVSAPMDLGRYQRMTMDYAVPVGPTLELCGQPSVTLHEGVRATVEWLRNTYATSK